MQIVIDIPEEKYRNIQEEQWLPNRLLIEKAIANGIPLPNGHGDLITKEQAIELVEFYQINPQHFDFVNLIDEIKNEKPIIPAEKGES